MKTFSHIYTNFSNLDLFLDANGIFDNPKLLVQIFSAYHTRKEISLLLQIFAEKFVQASLIGASH
ncbi:MAG: hypothetical protein WBK95_00175, partial [Sulfurimonas sp.]